jgi:hypothetical protein
VGRARGNFGTFDAFTVDASRQLHTAQKRRGEPLFSRFMLFPTHRWLKVDKGFAFWQRLARLRAKWREGEIAWEKLAAAIRGWINHVQYAETLGLRRAVLRAFV